MILLITLAPILAAVLIMLGLPARMTALVASVFTLLLTALEYLGFNPRPGAFQNVHSLSISPDLGLSFTLGLDGLSLVMVLLAAIVMLPTVVVLANAVGLGSARGGQGRGRLAGCG